MAVIHYTARAKDNRTLELPEEAQALGLKPGDEVPIYVNQNEAALTESRSDEEQQERFRILTDRLFAESDAAERQPGTYSNAQKANIADLIAEKHKKMGLQV